MKKFFPAVMITVTFCALMVSQMVLNGKKLSAQKINASTELITSYESKFKELSFETTKKNTYKLTQLKEPIVIINFWASWCRPCLSEFKSMNQLLDKYPQGIKIIGINNDDNDSLKLIAKIEKKHKLKFESVQDEVGKYAELFNITKIPATIVYANGKVIKFSNKEFDFTSKDFTNLLEPYLKDFPQK